MLISICIPAYKRIDYLQRLLDSVSIQIFKNFEVIISDDSPDESVQLLCSQYTNRFKLHYYKNNAALGTPANWNFAISKANGEWIKLMHDDDWFAEENALEIFSQYTTGEKKFIFCAYTNQYDNNIIKEVHLRRFWKRKLIAEPAVLFAENVIGPPSVTLVHRSLKQQYDERLKWRVDTDFYYRILHEEKNYCYINKTLINIGISDSQVTQSCINKPEIELPEGYILLQKQGAKTLKNIIVYDAWWRLLRNMNIRSEQQLKTYVSGSWPSAITNIISGGLSMVPLSILKIGFLSKILMTFSFLKSKMLH